MGLHIMASKRIPRKVKKALKYVYLLPRRNGNMIQYGGVDIIGNRSKWKRKAAKVLRARDLRKMINEMTDRLKDLYSSFEITSLNFLPVGFRQIIHAAINAVQARPYLTNSHFSD